MVKASLDFHKLQQWIKSRKVRDIKISFEKKRKSGRENRKWINWKQNRKWLIRIEKRNSFKDSQRKCPKRTLERILTGEKSNVRKSKNKIDWSNLRFYSRSIRMALFNLNKRWKRQKLNESQSLEKRWTWLYSKIRKDRKRESKSNENERAKFVKIWLCQCLK